MKSTKIYLMSFFIFLFFFFLIYFGYFFIKNEHSEDKIQEINYENMYHTKTLLNDLQTSMVVAIEEEDNLVEILPIGNEKNISIIDENSSHEDSLTKPKLVLIIDDVHTQEQIAAIQALSMKVTPSIFPPYSLSKHTHLLAKDLNHSMIHLPMESESVQFNGQSKTLMTSFSSQKIVERVIELRKLFPKTVFVNSHTGSVFTSDFKAMMKLYITLKIEGFTFIDSFTTAKSTVKKIAKSVGDVYLKRDVFIDNVKEISSIHNQLKKAVEIAKKNGYAIAIGHPHKVTMQALSTAQGIVKEVEIIYIDELKVGK